MRSNARVRMKDTLADVEELEQKTDPPSIGGEGDELDQDPHREATSPLPEDPQTLSNVSVLRGAGSDTHPHSHPLVKTTHSNQDIHTDEVPKSALPSIRASPTTPVTPLTNVPPEDYTPGMQGIEEEDEVTGLDHVPVSNPYQRRISSLPQLPDRDLNKNTFASLHKSRRHSVPHGSISEQEQQFNEITCTGRHGNMHRTQSGLGLLGEIAENEEINKSKILSLFEADFTNNRIKTFYNGAIGVLEDRKRQDKIIREDKIYIIHPLSTFRLVWDTLLLLAIFITMIILPIKLAFFKILDTEFSREKVDSERSNWYPLILSIDFVFMIDVCLSFFTGTIDQRSNPPKINLDRRWIQRRYLRTWFIPDLLSSIPFDVIGSEIAASVAGSGASSEGVSAAVTASRALLVAKILKLFSLVRVLRLGRLHFILKLWIRIFEISPLIIKIVQLLGFFFMIAHWSACFQFFVVYARGFPLKSWPVLLGIQDAPLLDQYTWSLFRSLSHMITIGYGKDPPGEVAEALLTIPSILLGAFFYMMTISQMTMVISMYKIGDIKYTEKLKDIDNLASKYSLDNDVHQRMHEFFHHKYGGEIHDDDEILNDLPLALKIDVIKSIHSELMDNVFFLTTACDGFIEQFILSAKPAVYMTGDIVVRSEDVIEHLFVITKGVVSMEFTTPGNQLEDDILINRFGFFGETPMLLKKKADMMVYAEMPCDFLLIPKFIFYSLIDRFPLFKNQMLLVTNSRVRLQGIDPVEHAPFLESAFHEAANDGLASRSSEDILELSSQARLNPELMEQFRMKNSADYSVFRKQNSHRKGDAPPCQLTPIDVNRYGQPKSPSEAVQISVSINDGQVRVVDTKTLKKHSIFPEAFRSRRN